MVKVTRSVSEGGKARPRLRFGLLGRCRKHLISARAEYKQKGSNIVCDSPNPAQILVIEDEPPIRKFVRAALNGAGYSVSEAGTVKEALQQILQSMPDLLILDLGLPDRDGLELLRQVREWSQVPVIVLSARGLEGDKVAALDAGADDYLTKPFGTSELLARLRVALRHAIRAATPGSNSTEFLVGDVRVDFVARRAFLAGVPIKLTNLEYRLLATLVQNAGKVLTHRFLLKQVWGPDAVHETHYLRVFTANLRKKLERDPAQPRYLLTEQGVGYRFADE
jgi:two-component system KDP operon response regulator KdpE